MYRYCNVKLKVKVNLEQATKAQKGNIVMFTFPLFSALDEGGWSKPCPGHFTPGKDPVHIVYVVWWNKKP